MPRQPYIWLWPDTHLFHREIRALTGRPHNVDELMVKNAAHLVYPQDTLIHLGDVIFYQLPRLKEMLDRIKAQTKVLVMGNHDRKSRSWYQRNGFDFACDMLVIGDVLFSHKPTQIFPEGVYVNVHGHLHNTGHRMGGSWHKPYERHMLVSIEKSDFKPVRLDQLLSHRHEVLKQWEQNDERTRKTSVSKPQGIPPEHDQRPAAADPGGGEGGEEPNGDAGGADECEGGVAANPRRSP